MDIRSSRVGRGALCYIGNTRYQLAWSNGGPNQKRFISKTNMGDHLGYEILFPDSMIFYSIALFSIYYIYIYIYIYLHSVIFYPVLNEIREIDDMGEIEEILDMGE